jgi:hypothetical protein
MINSVTHTHLSSDTLTTVDSYNIIDTETGATDDLVTITMTGAVTGDIIVLRTYSNDRDIVIKTTGNISIPRAASRTLGSYVHYWVGIYDSNLGLWGELCQNIEA